MSVITYKVVRHEGGWAYEVNGTTSISETFPTRAVARAAAQSAARGQSPPGRTVSIDYVDGEGNWHYEISSGDDVP